MASSDTGDLAITSDWKQHPSHQHGSAAEYPQESNDMRRIIIRSYNDVPGPSIKKEKTINPYSDPELERDIFGGLTYEEFDREYRYNYNTPSDPDLWVTISGDSDYISFKAFPNSKNRKIVYLPQVDTEDEFDDWVKCLIGQMKLAGLESYVPNKENNWSSVIMNNKRLHLSIVRMWKQCVQQECCPKWVKVNPYEPNSSHGMAVFQLMVEYNRRNKDIELWEEAINLVEDHMMSKGPKELWEQITRINNKTFRCKEVDNIISHTIQKMIVKRLATKFKRIKEEFIRNKDMELTLALKLLAYEAEESTTSKRTDNRREDKERKPYERSKKNPTNTRSNWNRNSNGTNRAKKSGKNYNKSELIKKKSKTNDDPAEGVSVFLCHLNPENFHPKKEKGIMLSSGTTVALIPNKHLLYSFTEGPKTALLVRGLKEIPVTGEGILKIKFNEKITIEMAAMVVPSVKMVIIPLKSLYKNNLHVSENGGSIKSQNDEIVTPIFEKNELWWISDDHIQVPPKRYQVDQFTKPKKHKITLRDLHRRLGHTDVKCIRETIKRGGIEDLSMSDVDWKGIDDFQCEPCMKGKASRHDYI